MFIFNESKTCVNPMVWRCSEFFLSKILVFNFFFDQIFFELYFLVIFLFLGIELCAQRIKEKKPLILWYRGAASSFFPIFSVFKFFSDQIFFEFYFFPVIFLFKGIELCAQRTVRTSRDPRVEKRGPSPPLPRERGRRGHSLERLCPR